VLAGRRFVVRGRVQGVGFRWFVEQAARHEGIRGYVRNQDDGSVEVVGEGEAESLLRFERAVRRGPSSARVDDVDTTELPPSGQFSAFSVTR